jgi:hypothetical protein
VAAGAGSVVIVVTTCGGSAWGVSGLVLWLAAKGALQPALLNRLVGVLVAPPLCALAARLPLRALLGGPVVAGLDRLPADPR